MKKIFLICLFIGFKCFSQSLINIAGLGQGDGLLANKQSITPTTLFTDSIGNVYFTNNDQVFTGSSSPWYYSVRKISSSTDIISTVAGGNNSPISSLQGSVSLLWLDHSNLYLLHNYVIKKLNLNNNVITTIAGNGVAGNTGDGGLALNASINQNITVALDNNGYIYINDKNNNYIRKIALSTGVISSFVTQTNSSLIQNLAGMCIDSQNNLLIAAPFSHCVIKANLTTSVVATYAGYGGTGNTGNGGLAINATFGAPWDVKMKSNGDVFILDSGNDNIRIVNSSGIISLFYYNSSFNTERNICIDLQGNPHVSDVQTYQIYKINNVGSAIVKFYGNGLTSYSGDGGSAQESDLKEPKEIHKNKQGDIYFIDQVNTATLGLCIRKIDKNSNVISTIAGYGYWGFTEDGGLAINAKFGGISDFAIDTIGNIYIADYDNRRIRKVDYSTGIVTTIAGIGGNSYSGDGGLAINAGISNINKIAVDLNGNVYIASDNKIRKIDVTTGIINLVAGTGLGYFDNVSGTSTDIKVGDMAFDSNNNLIITDNYYNRLRRLNTTSGIITTIAGDGTNTNTGNNVPPLNASFFNIYSVRLDATDNIYVSCNGAIRKIDSALTNISDFVAMTGMQDFYNGIPVTNCSCLNVNASQIEFDIINNDLFFSYIYLYKMPTNCSSANSPIVNLNVANQCDGNMNILAVSTNANYFFWLNSVNYSNSYTTNINGTYSVVVSNSVGCSTTETVNLQYTSCIWPGDANSDGIANNIDILELGLHYTQTGSPRVIISNSWQGFNAPNWIGTISNGSNLHHSDCNGDGTINDDDTLAISTNYGLTHTFKPAQTNTVSPQLNIIPDQAAVIKGTWGTASVYLGTNSTTINNVNGLAFTVNFDNSLIETNSIWIEYLPSFIDASQNLHFQKLNFINGNIYTATTHTVNNNVSGFGKIATLHYQIKSSLGTDNVLNLSLTQANLSNASGGITSLSAGSGTLIASGASVGVKESIMNGNLLISPNPTNGIINVTSTNELQSVAVTAVAGQVLLKQTCSDKTHQLQLQNFADGVYFVTVSYTNGMSITKKVIKQ